MAPASDTRASHRNRRKTKGSTDQAAINLRRSSRIINKPSSRRAGSRTERANQRRVCTHSQKLATKSSSNSNSKGTQLPKAPEPPTIDPSGKHLRANKPLQAAPEARQTRKRKRTQDFEPAETPRKRVHPSELRRKPERCQEDFRDQSAHSYIGYWAVNGDWPEEFKMENKLLRLLANKTLRRKRSEVFDGVSAPSTDPTLREEKNSPYNSPAYPNLLEKSRIGQYHGTYQFDHELGMSEAGKKLCERLLRTQQDAPKDTLFDDDKFDRTMRSVKGRNEDYIKEKISGLLVPSAETLAMHGAKYLDDVVDSFNEGWNDCIPITKPRPQSDAAYALRESAFSEEQFDKLRPCVGDAGCKSLFKGSFRMLFPFLLKEVKCGAMGLFAADNQNAHSATVSIRGPVELFLALDRQKELHQEPLAISVTHDDSSVRIHAYYPVFFDETKYKIYRHTVEEFYLNSRTKWISWTFVINSYKSFLPLHRQRLFSALEDLPSADTLGDLLPSDQTHSGLSQGLQDQNLSRALEEPARQGEVPPISPEASTNPENSSSKKQRKGKGRQSQQSVGQ